MSDFGSSSAFTDAVSQPSNDSLMAEASPQTVPGGEEDSGLRPLSGSPNVGSTAVSETPNHSLNTEASDHVAHNMSMENESAQQPVELRGVQNERDINRPLQLAVLIVGITFACIFTMPQGFNHHGRHHVATINSKAFAFNVFEVADVVSFFASVSVAVILGTVQSFPTKSLILFCKLVLCSAVGLCALDFLAAAYALMPAKGRTIAVAAGVATIIVTFFSFLSFHFISFS